jgi:hypothetical protein
LAGTAGIRSRTPGGWPGCQDERLRADRSKAYPERTTLGPRSLHPCDGPARAGYPVAKTARPCGRCKKIAGGQSMLLDRPAGIGPPVGRSPTTTSDGRPLHGLGRGRGWWDARILNESSVHPR